MKAKAIKTAGKTIWGKCKMFRIYRHTVVSVLVIAFLVAILITPCSAALYCVKVSLENENPKQVKAYLLRTGHDVVEETIENGEKIEIISHQKFYDKYSELLNSFENIKVLENQKERKKKKKLLLNDFKALIKQHRLRKLHLNKEGEMHLNVNPTVEYYLILLKKESLIKINKDFFFWVEKIYFEPGKHLSEPKEIILNESNVIKW